MGANQKGAIHLLLPVLLLATGTIFASALVNTTTKYPASAQVLGKDESAQNNEGQDEESSQKEAEKAKESAQKETEQKKESDQKVEEKNREFVKVNLQSEGNKSETEIETKSGQKIKTKVEDDGKTKVEVEDEVKTDASGSAAESDLQELRSTSKFPLRIDPTTNQLIMSKDGVNRVLTVLPAQAVQNMLRAHLKAGLGPKFFEGATPSATPASTASSSLSATPTAALGELVSSGSGEITVMTNQISLDEEDGQAVYKIPAQKRLKLLGVIPVTTDFTGYVSAENGALIKEQESLLSRILGFLSP